jgi:hypothetical protein
MKLKYLLLLILPSYFCLAPPARAASTEECQSLGNGIHCGNKTTDRFSVHGATPVAQSTATVTAYKSAQDHGFIASGQDYSVQHVTKALTAANIIAMYTTPVKVLETPGAGKSIVVAKVALTITRTATAFTGGGVGILQYHSTANGAGQQALDSTFAATIFTGSAGTSVSFRNGAVISDAASTVTQDKALYISNQTAVFAAGTGTAILDVWYYVL